jgi:hypothetical protein
MSRATMLFFGAFYAISLASCWEGISRQVLATVLSVSGNATYSTRGGANFRSVTPETTLGRGDRVRTSDQTNLDLILIPGILARASGDSEFDIEDLKLVKDGNETADGMRNRIARVKLNHGTLILCGEESEGANGRFSVVTNQIAVSANPGCLFQVEVGPAATRVTAVQGEVYTSDKTGETLINKGYFREWPSDKSEAIPVSNDSRGQRETDLIIQTARQLRDTREQHLPRPNRAPF